MLTISKQPRMRSAGGVRWEATANHRCGAAGRDAIPPSSEPSDGNCGNREGNPIGEGSFNTHGCPGYRCFWRL